MNKDVIASMKELLIGKREELARRVDAVKADFAKGHDHNLKEQVTERENEEVLMQIKDEAEQNLALVVQALHKIEEGSYGVCDSCHEFIDEKRLVALPFANLCIKCA
jgi:DnaK suppressor protein